MAEGEAGRHARSPARRSRSSARRRRSEREAAGSRPRRGRTVRAPAARQFRTGTLRAVGDGTALRCLVLVPGPDWVAVDLDSGALMRAPAGAGGDSRSPLVEEAVDGEGGRMAWPPRALRAVEITLGDDPEPPDPARPEAVFVSRPIVPLGGLRRRATKRLLQHLVTKADDKPILGTLGPSISYGDLDGTRPSVVVVAPEGRPRFGAGPSGPWCQFVLGGRRHTMPCSEGAPPDPSQTGHGTKLLVVALGSPHRGQVPKIVLGALPLG